MPFLNGHITEHPSPAPSPAQWVVQNEQDRSLTWYFASLATLLQHRLEASVGYTHFQCPFQAAPLHIYLHPATA